MARPTKGATGSKSAAPKPGTPPKPELASVPEAPPPSLVKPAQKVADGPEIKKKDLLERVAAQAGVKKPEAKPIVEAMLAVMGQALSDGEQLNLQPFGKVKVQKKKDLPNGQALTLKLRRSSQSLDETEALADPDAGG
ncbi:HU family DNA-binding protein [Palleronia pelagia]|uniref:DNA-binding protein HU-alpha n=1 Tax=Palleronia pelagia TaxID=387096 RepID=A0A1H8BGF4_9RHOB|nr:HU family DNA-binding protein [Palleronia pelagia]SEM82030.1 DNA-binding protein HU-alpha [Palleronia pelagia]